jgi:ribosome-associated translation inhibitor RaiA
MTIPWICIAPNVPKMALRGLIAQTLDPDNSFYKGRIDAIDFTLDGFVVSAKRLRGVATAVKDGRIGVEVADTGPNFGAAYTVGQNRHFTLREYVFQPDDFWRAQMVHEAVHASFDLAGESPANDTDEACAYLAETVYVKKGVLGRTIKGSEAAVAIYTAVDKAVDRLKLHTKSGQTLKRADVQDLIAAINAHPGYGHGSSTNG